MKHLLIILSLLISGFSYSSSLAVTPKVFKQIVIKETLPFKLTLLHLDLKKDNQKLEAFIGLGRNVKEKLPIMGSIYYQGQCIVFMQEKGITSYYKKLGINDKTVDISVYHEIGHCFTSKAREDKQYHKLHSFNITSEESAEQIANTEQYAQYVERYGDIYALSYIATHNKERIKETVQYMTQLRKIDATDIYDTYKGIDYFKTKINKQKSVDLTAFAIMQKVY